MPKGASSWGGIFLAVPALCKENELMSYGFFSKRKVGFLGFHTFPLPIFPLVS